MKLSPVMQRYVLHWGEMGARWGVNRTVAQIQALLYLSDKPLHAEEIAATLAVARSNVSMSLKELQAWGLVQIAHVMGDRRDHFAAKADLWDLLTTIVEERKKREIDPTLTVLRQCLMEAENDREMSGHAKERIARMHDFLDTLGHWYDDVKNLPRPTLVALMKMGSKVAKLVAPFARKRS